MSDESGIVAMTGRGAMGGVRTEHVVIHISVYSHIMCVCIIFFVVLQITCVSLWIYLSRFHLPNFSFVFFITAKQKKKKVHSDDPN